MIRVLFLWFVIVSIAAGDLEKQLVKACNTGDEASICMILQKVGAEPSRRVTELLLKLGVQTDSRTVYGAVRKAFAGIRGNEAFSVLEKALRNRTYEIRGLALFALSDIPTLKAAKCIIELLKARDPRIRLEAAKSLGKKPFKEVVDALINLVAAADRLGGEFSVSVRRSLYRLTGKDFKTQDDWEKWWRLARGTWMPDEHTRSGRTALKKINLPGKAPRFFGIEIFSLRVVFVIDTSGSMENQSGTDGLSKIDLVKQELIKTIKDLPPKARFAVVTFNSEIKALTKDLIPATPRNKMKAVQAVAGLNAESLTWTQEALEKAFSFQLANTIVLLSDGSPCKGGQILPTQPILDWVERANRFRKVTIQTIGFPQANTTFLRSLARENGGTYRYAEVEKKS